MATGAVEEVTVVFGAAIDDLKSKMADVQGIFGNLTKAFAALSVAVAGGAAFKSFIDEANKANSEAVKLSKTLGITGEEAGTLVTALGDANIEVETYTGAFQKFNRAIRTNSDELRALGVDIDAVKNGQKTSSEVFEEAVRSVGKYKAGFDQQQAAMRLFGRGTEESMKLLKLYGGSMEETRAKMEAARKKNEELNLTISQEGINATKEYKAAMNDVGDVMNGIKKTIGEGVLPVFTRASNTLASFGPQIIAALKPAVATFVAIWEILGSVVSSAIGIIEKAGERMRAIFLAAFGDVTGITNYQTALAALVDIVGVFGDQAVAVYGVFADIVVIAFESVVTVARSLMDAISSLTSVFSSAMGQEMPGAMALFTNALRIVQSLFIGFRVAIELAILAIRTSLAGLGNGLNTIAEVAKAAFSLDWAGVKTAWKKGTDDASAILREGMTEAMRIADKGAKDLEVALTKPMGAKKDDNYGHEARKVGAGQQSKGGTATFQDPKELQAQLAARLSIQKAGEDAAQQLTMAYLHEQSAANENAYANNLLTIREFFAEKQAIELAQIDQSIAAKNRENAAAKQQANQIGISALQRAQFTAASIKAEGDLAALAVQRAGIVVASNRSMTEAEQKRADALEQIESNTNKQIADLSIEDARNLIATKQAMLQISAEGALDAERQLVQAQYEIQKRALEDRIALAHGDVEKLRQIADEKVILEHQTQNRISALDREANKLRGQFAVDANKAVRNSFGDMVEELIHGTTKISDVFKHFALNVAKQFEHLIAQHFTKKIFDSEAANNAMKMVTKGFDSAVEWMIAQWSGKEVAQTAATVEGTAIRTAAEETAAEESLLITVATAIKKIAIAAWEAAASVYSAIAGIPYVGPFLAPAMAIAAGVAVLGFAKNIASAEQGWWHVPDDRVTQIHKDEMVMPAPLAQGIRDKVIGGGKGGGGGSNITIHAVDAKSIERLFKEQGGSLVNSIARQARGFNKGSKS